MYGDCEERGFGWGGSSCLGSEWNGQRMYGWAVMPGLDLVEGRGSYVRLKLVTLTYHD